MEEVNKKCEEHGRDMQRYRKLIDDTEKDMEKDLRKWEEFYSLELMESAQFCSVLFGCLEVCVCMCVCAFWFSFVASVKCLGEIDICGKN